MYRDNLAFRRLTVDCIIAGGTRVSWEMNPHMADEGPYEFQLQFSHTGIQEADDWTDVGAPVIDTYYMVDTEKRVWGKTLDPHYRVKLTTIIDTYYSEAEGCDGHLQKRDWLNAREIVRKESLRHRVLTSPAGYLLKARRYGPKCPDCLDAMTEEVSKSHCLSCFGTGFEFGYFAPMPACYADISIEQNREHRDASKGMDKQDVVQARFIGDPQIYSYDVWCNATGGSRYYIHTVKTVAQVRGVNIISDVELRLAPYTDVIYDLDLDNPPGPQSLSSYKEQKTWEKPRSTRDLNYLEAIVKDIKANRKTR